MKYFGFALGDSIIIMGVRGLPRMTDRHEYSEEEVARATFLFARYAVEEVATLDLAEIRSINGA